MRTRTWFGVVPLIAVALGIGWWWTSRSARSDAHRSATSAATPPSPTSVAPRDAGPQVGGGKIRVLSADQRRQLAEQIAAARARRAADPASSPRNTPGAPSLPAGAMDTPENVLAQIIGTLGDVKPYVADCVKQAGGRISAFQASITLTGDPDLGTLIDAGALTSKDGSTLPTELDDCVRGVMQTLVLPPMRLEDEFRVNFMFAFD